MFRYLRNEKKIQIQKVKSKTLEIPLSPEVKFWQLQATKIILLEDLNRSWNHEMRWNGAFEICIKEKLTKFKKVFSIFWSTFVKKRQSVSQVWAHRYLTRWMIYYTLCLGLKDTRHKMMMTLNDFLCKIRFRTQNLLVKRTPKKDCFFYDHPFREAVKYDLEDFFLLRGGRGIPLKKQVFLVQKLFFWPFHTVLVHFWFILCFFGPF